jgi:hypothetical protein
MEKKGANQFVWKSKDTLRTIDSDILRKVEPPIPVSFRLWGLPEDVVKDVDRLMRATWSIIVLCVTFETYLPLKFPFFLLTSVRKCFTFLFSVPYL